MTANLAQLLQFVSNPQDLAMLMSLIEAPNPDLNKFNPALRRTNGTEGIPMQQRPPQYRNPPRGVSQKYPMPGLRGNG
jgi:hypothetical protein